MAVMSEALRMARAGWQTCSFALLLSARRHLWWVAVAGLEFASESLPFAPRRSSPLYTAPGRTRAAARPSAKGIEASAFRG